MTPPLTLEELDLLHRALSIPTCWQPQLRDEALEVVKRLLGNQQSLFAGAV